MMGRKMLVPIEKRIHQASGREYFTYGGIIIIIVGNFQQLLPVGDKTMNTEGNA